MNKEKFESIIKELNTIKPHAINWGTGTEFGGYGERREIQGLELTPLIYDRKVFGFSHMGTVYYRTENLNALTIAKLYAANGYCKMQEI